MSATYNEVCVKGNVILSVAEKLNIAEIIDLSKACVQCFEVQQAFLEQNQQHRHDTSKVNDALKGTVDVIGKLTTVCQGLARGSYAEHARAIQEASAAFSWVTIRPAPQTFIKETMEGFLYWGNKVMVANKVKDPLHVDWVRAIQASINALHDFVNANYPTGFQSADPSPLPNAETPKPLETPQQENKGIVTLADVLECVKVSMDASSSIDSSVQTLTKALQQAVIEMGNLIDSAKHTTKPEDTSNMLIPLTKGIEALQATCNDVCTNPKFKIFALSVRELIPCLSWVVMDGAPATFVKENSEATDFHFNKILKDREPNQEKWVKSLKDFVRKLIAYITAHHSTGLSWLSSSGASSVAAMTTNGQLFGELQRGTAITEGLRKVSDQEKVYKQKREGTTVINVSALAERKKGKGWAPPTGNERKILLGNKKWMIEYFQGNSEVELVDIVVENSEKHHALFISRCQNVVIRVPAKVNTVSINECLRTKVILEGTIGPVEVTNSHYTEVMYSQNVPSLMIDKCQDTNIYVPEGRVMEFEAITSLSSNTNVILPTLPEERIRNEDIQETKSLPIPEQFVSKLNEKDKLLTSPTEHSCG